MRLTALSCTLLLPLLAEANPFQRLFSAPKPPPPPPPPELTLSLRHLHAVSPTNDIVFADVAHPALAPQSAHHNSHSLRTRSTRVHRPRSQEAFKSARLRSLRKQESQNVDWDEDEVDGPDVTDRATLLELAKMTYDSYITPADPDWYEIGDEWTTHYPFGWEPEADGFRGYVFATEDNSTVVVSIKGTSAAIFGGGGPTARKDKLNDNLLFSCCCARVGWSWTPACGCFAGGWKCDADCVEQALQDDSLFYPIGTNLYNNITYMYPTANIWLTGHSLGGALSALLGATFGAPVVAFEAPGDRMAARRLHLPSPPSNLHITHVFHNGDPIAMGTCNGPLSACSIGGYALESRCHQGRRIIFDTVGKWGWSVDIRTHVIKVVIDQLLTNGTWTEEDGSEIPPLMDEEEDCTECYSWDYGDYKNSSISSMRSL
ncbi:hypothetical protein BOTBODRAFT_29072 [Botryobasidium botryosum FD-172 SS1]|uniref:triacylglycerol lipase n=1 Tax=Botryobasidium botryosum (strain FD-172 SS1) TaxID=930990 RepID=A0A067N4J4_BOTB1|nr:hypothetical protein BOTBODRAFT_29072 [Botryobasidium botryosum FD-172 SS1]